MRNLQLALRYLALPKYLLLVLYALVASHLMSISVVEAGAWCAGVWIAHSLLMNAVRWFAFLIWGRRLMARVLLADLELYKLPDPREIEAMGEHYLRAYLDEKPEQMDYIVAGAWVGMIDYLRAGGRFHELVQLCLVVRTAVEDYKRKLGTR